MAEVWALSDEDLRAHLFQVFAQEQALAAHRLALVREFDGRDLARHDGATSLVAWLKQRLRINDGTAKRWVELARVLDSHAAVTAEALAAGAVNEEQAAAMGRALEAIQDVDSQTRDKAESELIGFAAQFEPISLARLGTRILDHVAPHLAEERLAKEPAAQEKQAAGDRTFTLTPDGTGKVRLTYGFPGTERRDGLSASPGGFGTRLCRKGSTGACAPVFGLALRGLRGFAK